MSILYTRQFVYLSCIASVLVCVSVRFLAHAQNSASFPRKVFRLVHLTNNEVAHLYFANISTNNSPLTPIAVQLQFLDSNGNTLLQPEPELVLPGETISLDLFGDGLEPPPGSSQVGVRAVVNILDPQARGLATLEIQGNAAASRFVLFDRANDTISIAKHKLCLGPLNLKSSETAKLTFENVHPTCSGCPRNPVEVTLEFTDGTNVLAQKVVTVPGEQSATLDLSNTSRLILGCARFPSSTGGGSLEIFDNTTGERVATLGWSHPSPGGDKGGGTGEHSG